jgi:hypothetical protein
MDKKDLLKSLMAKGYESSHLDDLVHTAASNLATNANNGGVESQVDFLMDTCGWSSEDIIKEM